MFRRKSRYTDGLLSRVLFRVLIGFVIATAFLAWTWLYSPVLISSGQQTFLHTPRSYKYTPEETSNQSVHMLYTSAVRKTSGLLRTKEGRHKSKTARGRAGRKLTASNKNRASIAELSDIHGNENEESRSPDDNLTGPSNIYNDIINRIADLTASSDTNGDDDASEGLLSEDLPAVSIPYKREIVTHPPNEKCAKRLPKALIVGVQKCGTSALMYFLSFHPEIAAVLHPQEVQYFSLHYNHKPLSWYKSKMNCSFSNQISMEKSPPYFYRPRCVDKIKRMDENIKIIVIVKDPVVRALSAYAMMVAGTKKIKLPTFTDVVLQKGKVSNNRLIRWSEYSRFMDKWIAGFGLSQIYVADGHALEEDPSAELSRVEEFLGIGSYFTADKFMFNETKGKQCFHHNNGQMECLGSNKGRQHATIPPDVLQALQHHFKPFNENFFGMSKKRFDWGY